MNFLEKIRKGSLVFVTQNTNENLILVKVTNVTPCHVMIGDRYYDKKTGEIVGYKSGIVTFKRKLIQCTPKRLKQYRKIAERLRLIAELKKNFESDLKYLNNVQLKKIVNWIQTHKKNKENFNETIIN